MAQNLKLEKVFRERTNLKHSSIISYTNGLLAFEKDTGVTPERVLDLSLPEIEDLLEGFVRRNKQKYAPKWLNVVYSSVVKWLVINRKIKNSHELRDIEFEKAKRKVAAMSENPIETYMIKNMFDQSDPEARTDLGLYAQIGRAHV